MWYKSGYVSPISWNLSWEYLNFYRIYLYQFDYFWCRKFNILIKDSSSFEISMKMNAYWLKMKNCSTIKVKTRFLNILIRRSRWFARHVLRKLKLKNEEWKYSKGCRIWHLKNCTKCFVHFCCLTFSLSLFETVNLAILYKQWFSASKILCRRKSIIKSKIRYFLHKTFFFWCLHKHKPVQEILTSLLNFQKKKSAKIFQNYPHTY